ncbi:hypothetical protein HMPREF9136_2067 [Prevotella dentalis DSM 3688]|uniref:Uncharacterized protein n=1 Tax=Prevotella dentalis (strain ATCC 49559 / DSM 3688 / JCM 13448 / NCTC 12043 / ES 2772) TaxID=908937 RepID=F9D5D9_PREDD|nr:hypothetical protein HMPREF9136_2067 [Prevotella dentalis DSM 3688]
MRAGAEAGPYGQYPCFSTGCAVGFLTDGTFFHRSFARLFSQIPRAASAKSVESVRKRSCWCPFLRYLPMRKRRNGLAITP